MEWTQLLCNERARASTNQGDHRAEFERDWDRAVFSTPVKRLQDKAQVFPLEPHDAVRTRLTHSLEVSSVARGLGTAIARWLVATNAIRQGEERWIEAITAVCGLIHDLGNPPFGHSGEDAIRHWFTSILGEKELRHLLNDDEQRVQDFLQFDGNAQSLRIVGCLQVMADFHGLNLTFGTLSATSKYTAKSDELDAHIPHKSKPGFFASESALVERIRQKTGTGEARNPLAFLVEAADDIVYSVADIEDAVKKGVLPWREVEEEIKRQGAPVFEETLHSMQQILKAGKTEVPKDTPGDVRASALRTAAIGTMIKSVVECFKTNYDSIMSGAFHEELVKKCDKAPLVEHLKLIGQQRVYNTSQNLKLELMGRKVIIDLMSLFWEGAKELKDGALPRTKRFPGKIQALLSSNYRSVFGHAVQADPQRIEYHRLRLVTDYVCGMTDTFAKTLHSELTNG